MDMFFMGFEKKELDSEEGEVVERTDKYTQRQQER